MSAGCSTYQPNPAVNTESGRLTLLIEAARQCAITRVMARPNRIGATCLPVLMVSTTTVPRASVLTAAKTSCLNFVSKQAVPESSRILAIQRAALDKANNPLDPLTRFSEFNRPIPPPICLVVSQEALNANVPRNQGLRCPLPNRVDLIVLPG